MNKYNPIHEDLKLSGYLIEPSFEEGVWERLRPIVEDLSLEIESGECIFELPKNLIHYLVERFSR